MPEKNKQKISASTSKNKRNCFLPRTRCTEVERKKIEAKAGEAGLTLSEYQRRSSLGSVIIKRESHIEPQLVSQLSAIGNNLNQLVRKTHIHDELDQEKMRETLNTIDRIIMGLVCDR